MRARGEHAFRVIKRQFRYGKVRYRGLPKNTAQLHTLFALANIWMARHRLALPEAVAQWSLTSLRDKLVKVRAKIVRHARYAIFQMAEVAMPRELFEKILRLIADLRPKPPLAPA